MLPAARVACVPCFFLLTTPKEACEEIKREGATRTTGGSPPGVVRWAGIALPAHEAVQVRRTHRALEVAEAALVLHLARRVDQAAHRRAVERGGDADAPHADGLELGDAERLALDAGHEVERLLQ